MNATTTLNAQTALDIFFQALLIDFPLQVAHFIFDLVITFLKEHGLIFGAALFVMFFLVTVKAMFGRWGSLGSFLYNLLYFSTLFVIGLIFGPEVFVGNWFGFFTAVILYPACYLLVGWILEATGVKR